MLTRSTFRLRMYGGDAAVALHFESGLAAFPARTEGGNESRHGRGARSVEGSEDGGVGKTGDEFVAAVPQTRDLIAKGGDGLVSWQAFIEPASSTAEPLVAGTAARMASMPSPMSFSPQWCLQRLAEGAVVAALRVLQAGPLLDQVGDQRSIHIEPQRQLQKVLLQSNLQA